jgi:hypothetical protein
LTPKPTLLQEHLLSTLLATPAKFALLAIAAVATVASAQNADAGRDLLYRSIRGENRANIVAILVQHNQDGDEDSVKFKLTRSIDGKSRQSVIAPLRLQGKESVDDGTKSYTFLPDEKMMIVQPSANVREDADFRIPLIAKNYILSAKSGGKIANRSVTQITALAREAKLGGVRFWLDNETAHVMKKSAFDYEAEEWTTDYEVLRAEFPSKIDPAIFKISPIGGFETLEYGARTKLTSLKEAEKAIGFVPTAPKDLPFGFQIQSMQTNSKSSWKSLSMRLTDGLQKVTVYQWKPSKNETISSGTSSTVETVNGIKYMVVTELDPWVRKSVLKAFVRTAMNHNYVAFTFDTL